MDDLTNEVRFYCFISGVLHQQQKDPLCRDCKAFENTAARVKEGLSGLQTLQAGMKEALTPELCALLDETRRRLEGLRIPEGAVGQKKAGRCRMPEGVCFVKYSKALREKI